MKTTMVKFQTKLGEFYLAAERRDLQVVITLHERKASSTKFQPVHTYGSGNVPVTARLIHQYCEGFNGTNGDIAPYVEALSTLAGR